MINLNNFLKNSIVALLLLAFSHNSFGMNILASASGDRAIKIWKQNYDQFKPIQTLDQNSDGHTNWIASIACNKDGLIASGSWDRAIKIWKPKTNWEKNQKKPFEHIQTIDQNSGGHTGYITLIAFNKDGLLVSGSWDNTIKVWNQNENNQFEHIQTIDQDSDGHVYPPLSLAFNKDGLFFSGSWDNTIKIWNQNENNQFEHIQTIDQTSGGHTDRITSLAFNKDGLLVSGSYDKTIKIWKLNTEGRFTCIQTIDQNSDGHTSAVTSLELMLLGPNKFNKKLKNNTNYRNIKIITHEE